MDILIGIVVLLGLLILPLLPALLIGLVWGLLGNSAMKDPR